MTHQYSYQTPQVFLRLPEVIKRTGLAKSTLYELIKQNGFPAPIRPNGVRCSMWVETEVDNWISEKISEARNTPKVMHEI